MSLEQSIATLTTEVANLIEEMRSMSAELRAVTAAVAAELNGGSTAAPAEKKPELAATQPVPAEPAVKTENTPVVHSEPAPKADEPYQPTITDTELKNAFVNLVNQKGRQAMTDILTDFGATKFSELPKDKYRDIDAAILKAMD